VRKFRIVDTMLLFAIVGCNERSTDFQNTSSETITSIADTDTAEQTAVLDSASTPPPPALLPLPVNTEPFVSNPQWPECVHPGVVEQCSDGWCKIPAGCFIFGTPEGTPGRAAVGEEQGPVTFTYDMEVMQTELTWAEYDRITGWPRKIYKEECKDDQCPANMSWWEAMLFANILSERHEPPLEKCYELGEDCVREPGDRMHCPNYKLTRPGYSCNGYRLPNQFEWQYLARGGTTTDFYTGNMLNPSTLECIVDPALEKVAWYCGNSDGPTAHPVGLLLPNRWGLYDLFGNVIETLQTLRFPAHGTPVTDPTEPDATGQRLTDAAGGNAISYPRIMHVARRLSSDFSGVRLVRTLGPGVLPQLPPN
jgi:sulfatase modifying factor 1